MRKAKIRFPIFIFLMLLLAGCKKESTTLLTQDGGVWYVEEVVYWGNSWSYIEERHINQGTLKLAANGEGTYTYSDSLSVDVTWEVSQGESFAMEPKYEVLSFNVVDSANLSSDLLEVPLIKAWEYAQAGGTEDISHYWTNTLHKDYVLLRSAFSEPSVEFKLTRQD